MKIYIYIYGDLLDRLFKFLVNVPHIVQTDYFLAFKYMYGMYFVVLTKIRERWNSRAVS